MGWPAHYQAYSCAIFSIFPTTLGTFLTRVPLWIPFASTITYRQHHEAEWIAAGFRPNASGVSDADHFWESEHPYCRFIIYRSCAEEEPQLFPLLTMLFAKPAIPIGLVIPPVVDDDDVAYQSFAPTMQWLDKQPNKSIIFAGAWCSRRIPDTLWLGLHCGELPL
ncbi:hypothetical protein E2562_014644 [Oryza meyeriana var. granulata]|uniref:Uncharacterized protein n=1 Tax=Oryza meyeriana var. granulata TaxID=110450 RepID=A0A6G1D3R5_9ORYZ|nr:hypothetical protein E2562_014644 [Oryza meyeriana var. granulata]